MGGVPGVVVLDGAVEEVPEGLLVGLGHPQVEGAGVAVRAEATGVCARRPPTDAVRVEGVAVRVEPLHAVGLVLPLAVEERLDGGHPVALPGLHLRPSTSRSGRSRAWSRRCRRSRRRARGSSRRTGSSRRSRRCRASQSRACWWSKWPRTTRQPRRRSLSSCSAVTVPSAMSAYSMTGHTVSPRSLAALISATRSATRCSTTPKTSSTVRPEASMRSRSAALISRMAAGRSSGADSQCGRAGSAARWRCRGSRLRSFGNGSLLEDGR